MCFAIRIKFHIFSKYYIVRARPNPFFENKFRNIVYFTVLDLAVLSVSLLYLDILIFSVSLLNGLLAQVVKFLELHVLASSAAPLPPSEESVTADARAVLEATPAEFREYVCTTGKRPFADL